MTCYFVIVGHNDNPIFEQDFTRVTEGGKSEDRRHLNQFVAHASLDLVDETKWLGSNLFLKSVDKFNDLSVTAFVTASHMRFLLVHERSHDSIRSFFNEVYEYFIKAMLNPFYEPNTPLKSANFRKKVTLVAKKHSIPQ